MNKCLIALTISALTLGACASNQSSSAGSPRTVTMATDQQASAMLGRVKSLAGEWTMTHDGKTEVASVFSVSSSGSAVREVMFPGSPHEMTNVYHMDGPDLIMTHYCAGGNQPRMRCVAAQGNSFDLKFDSVTNLGDASKPYMAEMTLTIKDADHISQAWRSFQNGQPCKDHMPVFELTRRK